VNTHTHKTCGATTRSGGACQKAPVAGRSRCRIHGGASPGAPKGNDNARTHGIHSRLTEEDMADADEVRALAGSLDDELFVTRLRLRRALCAELAAIESGSELMLDSETRRDGDGKSYATAERTRRRFDSHFSTIIDRLVGRIESLERTRVMMLAAQARKGGSEGDDMPQTTFIQPDEAMPANPIL
jgi:hypothetical protein